MRVLSRGRAIVRRLAPHATNRTFRPGDFVLVRSAGLLATAQGLASGGSLNHAALIVDSSGGLIEVDPRLVPGTERLRRTHVSDYLAANMPCWVGYVELHEGTRQSVIDFAERSLASAGPVTLLGAVALLLQLALGVAPRERTARRAWLRPIHQIFDQHALVVREEHTWLAGEFVARALERAGFLWECDPAYVTPAALLERFHLGDEGESGVIVALAPRRHPAGAAPAYYDGEARGAAATGALASQRGGHRANATHEAMPALPATYAALPEPESADGVRTILQVVLLTLGGIALAHSLESLLRQARES